MDRIRTGLTGLGAVFLVTAAASLLFAPDKAQTEAAAQQTPGEPLAQLGVAPGSDKLEGAKLGDPDRSDEVPVEPAAPLEAQPSGGPPLRGAPADPAAPSPVGAGFTVDPGRPVAV